MVEVLSHLPRILRVSQVERQERMVDFLPHKNADQFASTVAQPPMRVLTFQATIAPKVSAVCL